MIHLEGVVVNYDGVPAVQGVSLTVPAGGWSCLIGPNGAGKTTLLRAIAGLVRFDGDIRLAGTPVASLGRRELARQVAFVPQRPLVPASMTVTDYVLLGRTPYISYLGTESRRDLDVAAGAIARLDLEPFAERTLGSLSGGEVQRAVLARALAQQAPVLLLDEPTSSLDVGHQQDVLELVDELRWDQGLTIVSSMHDLTLAAQFAGSLLLLSEGRCVGLGPARTVLTEATIREHYGASVQILDDGRGGVVVVPQRPHRRNVATEEAILNEVDL